MLRTLHELTRHDMRRAGQTIGTVKDFLFDERSWQINHITVDTGGLLSHHDVFINPAEVEQIIYPDETIVLSSGTADEAEQGAGSSSSGSIGPESDRSDSAAPSASSSHIGSAIEVAGFEITGTDERIGTIHGLLIDTSDWRIRYLIVQTDGTWGGGLVLFSTAQTKSIDWINRRVSANASADIVRRSPNYDGDAELSREYEAFIHDYYGWPHYWT